MESSRWDLMEVQPKEMVEGMGRSGQFGVLRAAWLDEGGLLGLLGCFLF